MPPMPTDSVDVLIVGAGPTGLALALGLMRSARPPRLRIIDKSPLPAQHSRALIVQPRSLELLDQYTVPSAGAGIVSALRPCAIEGIGMNVYVRRSCTLALDMTLATAAAGTRYAMPFLASQAETEAVMAEALQDGYGITIERGVALEDLEQTDAACRAVLAKSRVEEHNHEHEHEHEHVTASYVVGCDGAHSVVRHKAGLSFHGTSYAQGFILCDAHIDWPTPRDAERNNGRVLSTWGDKLLTVIPLKDNLVRLISTAPAPAPPPPGAAALGPVQMEPPRLSEFQHILDQNIVPGATIRDPVWLSGFRLHHRGVDRYRNGRIFVVGDAAHIHSPVGGQGMNTGIQDATNLAWKLALVLRRERDSPSDQALLDSYHNERQPVGEKLLARTDRLFEYVVSDHWLVRFLRQLFFRFVLPNIMRIPARRVNAMRFFTQLAVRYRRSSIVGTAASIAKKAPVRGGWRAPNAKVVVVGGGGSGGRDSDGGGASGADETVWFVDHAGMKGRHFFVVFAAASSTHSEPVAALVETVLNRFIDAGESLHVCVVSRGDDAVGTPRNLDDALMAYVDASGELHRLYGFDGPRAGYVLIRPDAYVAHIGHVDDGEELMSWLRQYPAL